MIAPSHLLRDSIGTLPKAAVNKWAGWETNVSMERGPQTFLGTECSQLNTKLMPQEQLLCTYLLLFPSLPPCTCHSVSIAPPGAPGALGSSPSHQGRWQWDVSSNPVLRKLLVQWGTYGCGREGNLGSNPRSII